MKILGLIEIRPFDGTDPFVCLRVDNNGNMFDLPITSEQLNIVLSNLAAEDSVEEYEEESMDDEEMFTPSPVNEPQQPQQPWSPDSKPHLIVNSAPFSMGHQEYDEDDDL